MGRDRLKQQSRDQKAPPAEPSLARQLFLSSIPGVIVALIATFYQTSAQRSQSKFERQSTAIREYSQACNNHAEVLHRQWRFTALASALRENPDNAALVQFAKKVQAELDVQQKDMSTTMVALATARDVVNTLFRRPVDPYAGIELAPFHLDEAIRRGEQTEHFDLRANEYRDAYHKLAKACQTTVFDLGKQLE
jgi:hypothetical protein